MGKLLNNTSIPSKHQSVQISMKNILIFVSICYIALNLNAMFSLPLCNGRLCDQRNHIVWVWIMLYTLCYTRCIGTLFINVQLFVVVHGSYSRHRLPMILVWSYAFAAAGAMIGFFFYLYAAFAARIQSFYISSALCASKDLNYKLYKAGKQDQMHVFIFRERNIIILLYLSIKLNTKYFFHVTDVIFSAQFLQMNTCLVIKVVYMYSNVIATHNLLQIWHVN